jgi:hypothetical protein
VETFQHAGKLAAAARPEAEGGPAQPYPNAPFGLAFARGLWRPPQHYAQVDCGFLELLAGIATPIRGVVTINKIASRADQPACNLPGLGCFGHSLAIGEHLASF